VKKKEKEKKEVLGLNALMKRKATFHNRAEVVDGLCARYL
jgi:hypothetical protein